VIQIVGLSPSYKRAPPEPESWGLPWSPLNTRYDVWFEMHDRSIFERRGPEYVDTLRKADRPIYMQREWDDIPNSVEYPLISVIADTGCDYFQSSIAYMLGLAIHEHKDINLYGVDNHAGDEFAEERPCNEYLLGVAVGRGLQIWIHHSSSLLKFAPDNAYLDKIVTYQRRYGWLAEIL
jgi:hypothetical protein